MEGGRHGGRKEGKIERRKGGRDEMDQKKGGRKKGRNQIDQWKEGRK